MALVTPSKQHPTYFDADESSHAEPYDPVAFPMGPKRRRQIVLRPYAYQRPLIEHKLPARFSFAAWGNKAGKTTSAVMRMVRMLWETRDKRYRWIAPFHSQSEIAQGRILKLLPKGTFEYYRQKGLIIGPQGSRLTFHSGERPDTLPGDDVDGAILDEASRLREAVYINTVTTLLSTKGWLLAISTPHGRNWFYQQCKRGMEGEKGFWFKRYPSVMNPNMDQETVDHTMRSMPQPAVDEAIYAQFITDAASIFPDLEPCGTRTLPRNRPDPRKHYIIAVDVGQIRDANVATVWDVMDASLVSWAVAKFRDYTLIVQDLEYMSKYWNGAGVLVERNNAGKPIIDMLNARGVHQLNGPDDQKGFTTTGGNKPALVQQWGMALRNKEPILPSRDKWPELYVEHENYEYTIAKSGHWSFEAGSGHHDDIVMSCLLGWWAVCTNTHAPSWWRPGTRSSRRRRRGSRDKNVLNE